MLEKERNFYTANLSRWLKEIPGKFVVIKDETLLGSYESIELALSAGAEKFGMDSFLVRMVGQAEEAISIPALTLGILNADSSYTDNRSSQST